MTSPASAFTLSADRVVTPAQVLAPGWLRIGDGRVQALGSGQAPGGTPAHQLPAGSIVVPGFVDMHVHGAGGGDMTAVDAEEIERARTALLHAGVTSAVASLVTAPFPELEASLAIIADLVERPSPGGARLVGAHLEGPFISPEHAGSHDVPSLRLPDVPAAEALLRAGRGTVRMMTLAPELEGSGRLLRLLDAHGVVAAVGHTGATYEQTRTALDQGVTVGTHLFNGMRSAHHREPGPALSLLDDPRVTVELINDGVHIHPAVARVATRAAHHGRLALISDGVAATGAPDGLYMLGRVAIRGHDGRVETADGKSLGGGASTLDGNVRRAVTTLGMDLSAAVCAATAVPARALGIDRQAGSLVAGRTADLCVLDADLHVVGVMQGGNWMVEPFDTARGATTA